MQTVPTQTPQVAKTQDRLADKQVKERIRKLSQADRDAILALKPYLGGNILLYALNHLNIKDKHRKLHVTGVERGEVKPSGMGHIRLICLWDGPFQDGDPVARWDADDSMNLDIALAISLADVPGIGRPPLIEMLREFSNLTRSIIGTFS